VAFSGSLDLYEAGADWSELTLTALNAPSLGALASSDGQIEIQRANQGLFVQIDLTPRVEKWVKGQLT